jgi:hypothetical protein
VLAGTGVGCSGDEGSRFDHLSALCIMPIRELSEELISDIEASYGPLLHDLNLAQNGKYNDELNPRVPHLLMMLLSPLSP